MEAIRKAYAIWAGSLINSMYDWMKRPFLHSVSRSAQVAFIQLRLGFCNLKYDLYKELC